MNLMSEKYESKSYYFVPTSRLQMVSIGTSLIPFVEHNDANRALMGSNMQRQAVPLIKKQKPIVSTGLESIVIYNNEYNIISIFSGLVKYNNKKKIIVHENIEAKTTLNGSNGINLSQSFLEKKKKNLKLSKYKSFKKRIYKLKENRSTNQNTNLYEKSITLKDEWIKKGQILTDGASTNKGKLSLGRNVLVAYMPWTGYNFEDAIVISERLLKEETFTSIHIKKYKTFLIENETGGVKCKLK